MDIDAIIADMILSRNSMYDEITDRILKCIPEVLAGINMFFSDNDYTITYGDVFLDAKNASIFIVSKPVTNPKTKEPQQITIGIPIELVNECDADAVYRFLLNADMVRKQQAQMEYAATIAPSTYTIH